MGVGSDVGSIELYQSASSLGFGRRNLGFAFLVTSSLQFVFFFQAFFFREEISFPPLKQIQ